MTEPTYLSEAEAKLHSFQNARQELQTSLAEVEEQIARSEELRDAIMAALDESGAPEPAAKKAPAKKAAPAKKTAKKAAVADPVADEDETPSEGESAAEETPEEEPAADVADHLPSGETQDDVIDNGGDLDDWEPGEVEPASEAKSDKKNSSDELNFDEIQF